MLYKEKYFINVIFYFYFILLILFYLLIQLYSIYLINPLFKKYFNRHFKKNHSVYLFQSQIL